MLLTTSYKKNMRKLYAAFVNVDVERLFVYRMSEKPIKQEFLDGTIETENSFGSRWALHEIFGGTSGVPLDTSIVHSSNVMVYYSLKEENIIRFLKEKRMDMISFTNLLSKRLQESEITFARIRDEYSKKQYKN